MSQKRLIVITGLPATGKTTLGRKLAEELSLPFVSKDDIKELLFDSLGWSDRAWSKKLSISSYELLYYIADLTLKAQKSLIIETNFDPKFASKKIRELEEKYECALIQIRCLADGEVLWERFKKRADSNERHPGHVDADSYDEWGPILLKGKIEALDIDGKLIDIDTTDFDRIDVDKLLRDIE